MLSFIGIFVEWVSGEWQGGEGGTEVELAKLLACMMYVED